MRLAGDIPSASAPRPALDGVPALAAQAERIRRLAEASATADDPEPALRASTQLRRELDAFERMQVERSLATGRSFGEVARALGISRQAAHRRYRDVAPVVPPPATSRLVATEQARRAVRLARAETLPTRETAVGTRQLLLGILQTDSEAARALRSEGVTLKEARACTSMDGGDGDAGCLRRVLQRAGRDALSSGERHLRPERLLLAALADADDGAGRTLTALGATPSAIRARLAR
jgi:hypothetical protein